MRKLEEEKKMTNGSSMLYAAILAAGTIGAALVPAGQAMAWEPTEEVELVIHSSPTSSTNFFVRMVEGEFDKMLPHGANSVNMTGGGGDRARRYILEAEGNPHVMMGLTPSNINNPLLQGAEYGVKDFTPLATLIVAPLMICVNANSPYHTLDDLIEAARAKPNTIVQGGGDVGEVDSLEHVLLSQLADVEMIFTPFESKGVVELLGGHIDFIMVNPGQCNPYLESGDFRLLATSVKLDAYPDTPTFAEAGYPFRVLEQYRGFWMPRGVDPEVRQYYTERLLEVAESEAFHDYAEKNNMIVQVVSGDDLAKLLAEEQEVYLELDKMLGLLPE